jgi:hypothetical protein
MADEFPPQQVWKFEPEEENPAQAPQSAPLSPPSNIDGNIDAVAAQQPVQAATINEPEQNAASLQAVSMPPQGSEGFVRWTSLEFAHHEKTASWYGALVVGTVVFGGLIWLLTKSIFSLVVLFVCATVLGVFAARKPREFQYELDEAGLRIEQKTYSYGDFRSFSIIPEGSLSSIVFIPMKRFLPPTTIYYDPADEPKIVSVLSARIPLEPARRDVVDRFVARIRF